MPVSSKNSNLQKNCAIWFQMIMFASKED